MGYRKTLDSPHAAGFSHALHRMRLQPSAACRASKPALRAVLLLFGQAFIALTPVDTDKRGRWQWERKKC